ncbi:hypothetical protein RB195_015427 [Necator americanus]|uniref:Reverse transcriptase domain-containing protein n=1 Tax=Necator americanus TaxID=51031 RepID=A0ABR1E4J7_NECAM
MTALRNPKGTTIASRRGMEKIIYDFYSDLFDSHVHLPPHHLREDGYVTPELLPSEIRHAIMSVKSRTAPGPDRIRPEQLKDLPPVLINTLARLFTRYLSECKVPKQYRRPARPFTLENAMRKMEWDDMGVKVDGRQLHHLRHALITPNISQKERLLTKFDETCGCIGLQLNLQ